MRFRQLLPLFGALFALYIIWGSTYFVIRIGVESWPPLMMAGVRFLAAGILLLAFLLLRGHKLPPLRPLLNAALIGLLLLAVGNGMVTVAEHQNVRIEMMKEFQTGSFRHRRRSGCNRAPLYPVLQPPVWH